MSTTDKKFPRTEADSGSSWDAIGNADYDDSHYDKATDLKDETSSFLILTNFGFTTSDVPVGSTITGIEVEIMRYVYRLSGLATVITDNTVQLINGAGTPVGDNKASGLSWPLDFASEALASYGDPSDNWSASLTASDIIDSDFGFRLAVTESGSKCGTPSIEYVKIRITYTVAGGGSIKKLSGVAWASVKKVLKVAEASLKKVAGVVAN